MARLNICQELFITSTQLVVSLHRLAFKLFFSKYTCGLVPTTQSGRKVSIDVEELVARLVNVEQPD